MIQSIGFQRLVFALLVVCIVPATTWAQYGPAEYSFRQQSVVDGQAYNNNGDPIPVLSMNCLAANGYGQWTYSSTAGQGSYDSVSGVTEFPAGWYLLGNGLDAPCVGRVVGDVTNHPVCTPPGVVQCAPLFGSTSEVEVTTNLDGSVDYIWPNSVTRQTFVINQFTSSDVDLSLAFISDTTLPKNVVTSTIHTASLEIPTSTLCSCAIPPCTHAVMSVSPYQDEFQVSSDARYIYIVWVTDTNKCVSPTTEVWATVVDRTTDTTVTGWPQRLGNGLKPTVSCDPRNNRVGTPSPAFEAAWIIVAPTNVIERISCTAGSLGTVFSLPPSFINPISGTTKTYSTVSHARILVSSAPGVAPTTALYAIVEKAGDTALIFYRPANATSVAAYVDGMLMPSHPAPAIGVSDVLDNFITAFANPYDIGDHHDLDTFPDQFHCVYQISIGGGHPLLIVEGKDNGELYPSNTQDVRTVINVRLVDTTYFVSSNPTTYCAAVNQMGIHVHWRSYDPSAGVWTHYYARDMNRAFDEPIEENTLVTDQCYLDDATYRGGTQGATVTGNHRITMWTDPNYGPPSKDGTMGFYQPGPPGTTWTQYSPVGSLNFLDDDVKLTVGDNTPGTSATLAVMPYYFFIFGSGGGTGEGVTVNSNSVLDFFGCNGLHNSTGALLGPTAGFSSNEGTFDLEGTGTTPAIMNVHGGADFYTASDIPLIANHATINILHEPGIENQNPPVTGHMTLFGGGASLNNSTIIGNSPAPLYPLPGADTIITSLGKFVANNCTFENTLNTGISILQLGVYSTDTLGVDTTLINSSSITHSNFFAAQIHAINIPQLKALTVDSNTFDTMRNYGVFVENTGDPVASSYGPIDITGNNFLSFASNIGYASVDGIYVKNFDGPLTGVMSDSLNSSEININANTFLDTNNMNNDEPFGAILSSAIALENSTAWVMANTIEDRGYAAGITNWATPYIHELIPDLTHSFICSNIISGLNVYLSYHSGFDYGIYSSFWHGYFKLNTIKNCDDGYITYGNDKPMFVADSIIGNNFNALIVQSGSIVDMSGIHSMDSSATDAAGFNTITGPSLKIGITNPSISLITLDNTSNLILANEFELFSWVNFGLNNIFVSPRDAYEIQPIIQNESITPVDQIGSIDRNYFGGRNPALGSGFIPGCTLSPCSDGCGKDPSKWNSLDTNEVDALFIDYCATPGATTTSGIIPRPRFDCGSGTGFIADKGKGAKPLSVLSQDSCLRLYSEGVSLNDNQDWLASYDSLKKYIDECPNDPNAHFAFNYMSEDVQSLEALDTVIYSDFQLWLRSVLYLDTIDPEYFCQCAEQIGPWIYYAKQSSNDSIDILQFDTSLAVLYWLIQHTNCDSAELLHEYEAGRASQLLLWQETSSGSYPLDTTLPPLPPALDSLLERHLLYASVTEPPQPGILSNATANPNPAGAGTVISFSIAKEAYVRIELFDVLGHEVSPTNFENLFEPGNKSVPFSLQGLPSGTYFARIMTAYGEVQSVKLVKE